MWGPPLIGRFHALAVEVFNALNEATVLQSQNRLGTSTSDHVLEVLSPRVWRVGVRLRFR